MLDYTQGSCCLDFCQHLDDSVLCPSWWWLLRRKCSFSPAQEISHLPLSKQHDPVSPIQLLSKWND